MKTLHRLNPSWSRAVRLALALLCFVGSAGSAHGGSTDPKSWPPTSTQVTSQFAIADFDGDSRPDLATVQAGVSSSWDTHYWIAFQLSSGPRQTLGITAPNGGLHITSRDVNGDDFLDVVVTTAWTNRPVAVLLNDGQGKFRASSPSAFPGAFTPSEKSWPALLMRLRTLPRPSFALSHWELPRGQQVLATSDRGGAASSVGSSQFGFVCSRFFPRSSSTSSFVLHI